MRYVAIGFGARRTVEQGIDGMNGNSDIGFGAEVEVEST
jgi:hypothetical protein